MHKQTAVSTSVGISFTLITICNNLIITVPELKDGHQFEIKIYNQPIYPSSKDNTTCPCI